jgi:hypothetical protein
MVLAAKAELRNQPPPNVPLAYRQEEEQADSHLIESEKYGATV